MKKIRVYFVMRAILLSMAAPSSVKYLTQTTVGCMYVIPYLCYTNLQSSVPHQEENLQFVSDDNLAVIRGDIVKLQQTSVSPVTHQPSILNVVNLSGNDPPCHVYQCHHHRFIFLSRSHPITYFYKGNNCTISFNSDSTWLSFFRQISKIAINRETIIGRSTKIGCDTWRPNWTKWYSACVPAESQK